MTHDAKGLNSDSQEIVSRLRNHRVLSFDESDRAAHLIEDLQLQVVAAEETRRAVRRQLEAEIDAYIRENRELREAIAKVCKVDNWSHPSAIRNRILRIVEGSSCVF